MTHSYVWHDSFIRVTWLIHMCDIADSLHDSFICVTWLIHMCDMTHSYVWHDSFICVTWLIRMCDMTHSCVWHDSFICLTCIMHMCDLTSSYLWHASFIRVTWILHTCDMTHSHVWHNSALHPGAFPPSRPPLVARTGLILLVSSFFVTLVSFFARFLSSRTLADCCGGTQKVCFVHIDIHVRSYLFVCRFIVHVHTNSSPLFLWCDQILCLLLL